MLQIPQDDLRHHYVRTKVQVRPYLSFFGNRCWARYDAKGQLMDKDQIKAA